MAEQTTSILTSIKKLLGIDAEYNVFDDELILHINTVFSVLHHIGAAPPSGFFITDESETWESFLLERFQAQMVKTYVYLKVRMIFDPPAASFVMASYERQAAELEWRLNTMEILFNPEAFTPRPVTSVYVDDETPISPDDGVIVVDPISGNVWQEVEN